MATPRSISMSKPSPSSARSKKVSKSNLIILRLSPEQLRTFPHTKAEPTVKAEIESKVSLSATSNTIAADSPGGNASESNSNTPAPSAVDDASSMPPPTEGVKKGVKRSSAAADGLLKPRAKPGPKKKAKLDDCTGTGTPGGTVPGVAAHKLGPKANQGAINAGLRALDRSGKPCRKWNKGGFQIKSFTGTVWEIPRWKAPPKVTISGEVDGASSGDSSKENKDSSQGKSEPSMAAADMERTSSQGMPASSPAPMPIAAA